MDASKKIAPGDQSTAGVQSTLVDIERQLTKISSVRESAYTDSEYISLTVQSYNELISSLLSLSQDMAQATSNRDMINNTRALATFSSAKEYASIQRAIIAAGLAEPRASSCPPTTAVTRRRRSTRRTTRCGGSSRSAGATPRTCWSRWTAASRTSPRRPSTPSAWCVTRAASSPRTAATWTGTTRTP
ncbi:nitrate- and nitrite sensing domain-containing protein [Streptomyces sp. M19]